MGTDIHLFVERRENGQWISADTWVKDADYGGEPRVPYDAEFYHERNYDTFAILAGVRNGRGVAGIDTGNGFVPIASPRGLPDDMSPELAAYAEGCDHTPSWLTVAELLAYDWTQVTVSRGVVSGPQFHRWMLYRDRAPASYCGAVAGPRIEHVTAAELERRIAELVQKHDGKHWQAEDDVKETLSDSYAQVAWKNPYYRAASTFLSECMPKLWRLGKPEVVRIVFWFDS